MASRYKTTYRSTVQDAERSWYSRILFILIILALAAGIYMLWPRHADTRTRPAASDGLVMNVVPLTPQPVTITDTYIGYVTPVQSVDLVPKINGYLDKIWVKGGQDVKAGDNLVMIRQNEYKAQLDAAKAQVTQARADFNNAQIYYERIKKAGAKAISKTEVDNAKAKYLAAQGALAQANANQALAQVNYDYTLLKAPITGTVGNVDLTKGNYVSPASAPLLKIIQYDPIRVVFSITDKAYLDEMRRHPDNLFGGEKIRLRLSNGAMYQQPGRFQFTANEIDRATNSIAVYADFANPNKTLVANAYVDVLVERTIPEAVLVRQNYVTMSADGNFVYTVRDGQLFKTPVEIITAQGPDYVLADTFQPGEYLVVDKVGTIDKNTKIRIKVLNQSAAVEEKA